MQPSESIYAEELIRCVLSTLCKSYTIALVTTFVMDESYQSAVIKNKTEHYQSTFYKPYKIIMVYLFNLS